MKRLLLILTLILAGNADAQTLTITTANKSLQLFLSDVAYQVGYQDEIGGEPNPQSKADYGVEKITEYVGLGYDVDFFIPAPSNVINIRISSEKKQQVITGFAYTHGYKDIFPETKKEYSLMILKQFIRDSYRAWKADQVDAVRQTAITDADNYTEDIEVTD